MVLDIDYRMTRHEAAAGDTGKGDLREKELGGLALAPDSKGFRICI